MKNWTTSTEQPGYKYKTITDGDFTVKIYKPILDPAESTKREAHLKQVAERTYRDYLQRKEKEA